MSTPTETLSRDYAATAETLSAILRRELSYYSCKGYLNPSDPSMITAADRKKLVDWCYGVVDHYQLSREAVATTMEMVDRFISVSAGPLALWDVNSDVAKVGYNVLHCPSKFQLLTVAALYSTLEAKDNMIQFDESFFGVYTKEDIENMEHTLQRGLSWRTNTPSSCQVGHTILSLLLQHVSLPEATWCFLLDEMNYQTEVSVRDYYFSTQRPSTIAMAAISNAIESIGNEAHKGMLKTCLSGILECYDFDHDDLVAAAKRRLHCYLQGGSIIEEGTGSSSQAIIHDSTKTSKLSCEDKSLSCSPFSLDFLDQHIIEAVDDFMKTFPTNSEDKKMLPPPVSASTATTVSPDKNLTRPKRPLTAYHIYLAIEREFIIQSIPGENADKSADDDKVYLDYVPERYRQTKLSPDWYKRKKRKHRKQHGKIGFKELTTMIASRWADLDKTNPDIKRFVQNLAERELMEYHREMEEYEKQMVATATCTKSKNAAKRALDDLDEENNALYKLHKKPRLTPRSSYLFGVHSIAEAVDKKCPNDITLVPNDLKTFHYRPVTKHEKNSISTNMADCTTGERDKSYHRLVSWMEGERTVTECDVSREPIKRLKKAQECKVCNIPH